MHTDQQAVLYLGKDLQILKSGLIYKTNKQKAKGKEREGEQIEL